MEGTFLSSAYNVLIATTGDVDQADNEHKHQSVVRQLGHESIVNAALRNNAQQELDAVDGPRVDNHVALARTRRKYIYCITIYI